MYVFVLPALLAGMAILAQPFWDATSTAHAQTTIEVDELGGGDCTLILAIELANTGTDNDCGSDPNGAPYSIVLETGATYSYTTTHNTTDGNNALPSITSEIILIGNGATIERADTVDADDMRLFHIAATGVVRLENLTIQGGVSSGGSVAGRGGAIYVDGGQLMIVSSDIQHNRSTEQGGAIYQLGDGSSLEIVNSTVYSNSAAGGSAPHGGAIYMMGNSATLILSGT